MERFGQKGVEILMQRINEKKENKGSLGDEGHINIVISTRMHIGGSVNKISH